MDLINSPTRKQLIDQEYDDWKLTTNWLGKTLEHYAVLPSTQELALKRAQDDVKDGTIIIADSQTNGRGQLKRTWHSSDSKGLWFSLIIKPELESENAHHLTLLTAVALSETIRAVSSIQPKIKWPNDILIKDKKVAGILTETKTDHLKIRYAVIGIGLNLNQSAMHADIQDHATSLKIESSKRFDKKLFLNAFLTRFEGLLEIYLKDGFDSVKGEWLKHAFRLGEVIHYKTAGVNKRGVLAGISDDGALLIKNENNELKPLYSAEIMWF